MHFMQNETNFAYIVFLVIHLKLFFSCWTRTYIDTYKSLYTPIDSKAALRTYSRC